MLARVRRVRAGIGAEHHENTDSATLRETAAPSSSSAEHKCAVTLLFLLTLRYNVCSHNTHTTEEAMQIVSIRDKRIKKLADNPDLTSVKGFNELECRKVAAMLAAIRVMTHPLQLGTVPAWRAHELTPGHPGKWALMVTGNYRLTFHVDLVRQEVRLLDYEDYH